MSTFETWLLSYLLNSLWQVPFLFIAGYLAAHALRKTSPAAEHRVWACTLLLQALLPAFSTIPWNWLRIPLPWNRAASPINGAHISVIMGAGTTPSAFHLPATILATITVTYIAISAYFAVRFLWRCRSLRALRVHAAEVRLTGPAAACWSRCEQRFGIKNASIAASPRIFGPVTIGLARKLVLLPESMASTLPESDLRTIITHEFAHMRRNDFTKNLLYELLSLPISYHPLAWLTREHITESREILCDQMASELGSRSQYARSLLRLASLLVAGVPARSPHAIGIFDTRKFERRIMKLSEKRIEIRGVRRLAIVIACAAFGVAACGSALALGVHVDASATSSASHGTSPSPQKSVPAGVMRVGDGVSAPVLIHSVDPKYTAKARRAKYQGICVLGLIVDKNGIPQNIRVVRKLGMGLDEKAVEAVKQFRFKPGYYKGHAVPVQINVEVNFRIYR